MDRNGLKWATLIGLLVALTIATAVQAGGWSVVTLDSGSVLDGGSEVVPGSPISFGFTVLQHGKTPLDGLIPTISARNAATGEVVTAQAKGEGGPGHYVATITLPTVGTWSWQIEAFGAPTIMAPLLVAAPQPVVAASQPVAPGLALPLVLAAVAVCGALFVRARRHSVTA